MLNYLLRFLTWSDSSASMKAAGLLHSVVRQLATDDALTEEIVIHITTTVLQALQIHGHYDPAQGLLLTLGKQEGVITKEGLQLIFV